MNLELVADMGVIGLLIAGPFIAPALGALGISGTLSSLISGIITTAIGFVLQILFAPSPPKPDDGRNPFQQPIPFRGFGYGRIRMAGAVACFESPNKSDLYYVAAICSHRISAVIRHYLHDDVVELTTEDGFTFVTDWIEKLPGEDDDHRYRKGGSGKRVFLYDTLGPTPNVAIQHIVDGLPGLWTVDHRGDNCATLGMVCFDSGQDEQATCYPFGIPKPSVEIDAAFVFDPRVTDANPYDESTWVWSENPALIILHYLVFNEFGPRRSYDVAIAPVLDAWIDAAVASGDDIPLKAGGTVNRYKGAGWATTENEQKKVLNEMLSSCDGHLVERGDRTIILRVGKFVESSVVITDNDILGFYIQTDIPDEDVVNRMQIAYTEGGAFKYTLVEIAPIDNTADQVARGYIRESRMEMKWTKHNAIASRLAKREMYRQQCLRGWLKLRIGNINACYERFVYVNSNIVPRLNGKWIETRPGTKFQMYGGGIIHLEFIIIDPDDYDSWVPSVDEHDKPPTPGAINTASQAAPEGASIVAESFHISSGVLGVRLAASFDETSSVFGYVVRWRPFVITGDPDNWQEQVFSSSTIPDPVDGRVTLRTGPVQGDTTLEWAIATVGTKGGRSEFVTDTDGLVDTMVDDTAPGIPKEVFADLVPPDAVNISWKSPNSENYVSGRIYRNTVDDIPTSTLIHEEFGGSSTHFDYTDESLASDDYWYWVRSVNGSGVMSVAVATGMVTIP